MRGAPTLLEEKFEEKYLVHVQIRDCYVGQILYSNSFKTLLLKNVNSKWPEFAIKC